MERVRAAGLQPDTVLYTTLIHGCVCAGNIDRAWSTFMEMRKHVAEPDEVTFTVRLLLCFFASRC
jgi:pentatricopeptide repeat protein